MAEKLKFYLFNKKPLLSDDFFNKKALLFAQNPKLVEIESKTIKSSKYQKLWNKTNKSGQSPKCRF